MTSHQTIAVIEFMDEHCSEHTMCFGDHRITTYACGEFTLDIYNSKQISWRRNGRPWSRDGKYGTLAPNGMKYWYWDDGSTRRSSMCI